MEIPTSPLFRQTLSHFATGVSILTGQDDTQCLGMTINSLASVSLEPPLVLFSLKKYSPRHSFFQQCKEYAISILSHDQKSLADHFSRQHEVDWEAFQLLKKEPLPLFEDSLAHLKGIRENLYSGGDHTIFLMRVTRLTFYKDRKPLLFYKSDYHTLIEDLQAEEPPRESAPERPLIGLQNQG